MTMEMVLGGTPMRCDMPRAKNWSKTCVGDILRVPCRRLVLGKFCDDDDYETNSDAMHDMCIFMKRESIEGTADGIMSI